MLHLSRPFLVILRSEGVRRKKGLKMLVISLKECPITFDALQFSAKAPDLFSEISKQLKMKEMAKIGGTLDQSS